MPAPVLNDASGPATATTRAKVFLSYRRSDTQHAAGRAADKLADRFDLFMDIDTIPPGVDFTEYLRRAVGGCDVLLAFIGETWGASVDPDGQRRLDDPDDWVVAEIATALARGVPVIPVLVDDAAPPSPDQLPTSLQGLAHRQATPLRFGSFSADLNHLVAAIDHTAGADTIPQDPHPAPRPAFADHWNTQPAQAPRSPAALAVPAERPRRASILIGVGVAALAGAAVWAWSGLRTPAPVLTATTSTPAPSAQQSVSPAPTVPPARTVAELKRRVPEAFRSTCRKLTPTDDALARNLVVAVQCAPARAGDGPRPRYAFYFQYSTATAAQTAFREYYADGPPGPGDCTTDAGETLDERADGSPFGVLRCYRDADGFGVLAWIAPEQAIVASAADADRDFPELFAWWAGAGPHAG